MLRSSTTLTLALAFLTLPAGCPPQAPDPQSGGDRLVASLDGPGPDPQVEGFSAEEAAALSANNEPIPQDLSAITYFGEPLFEPGTTAKTYARSASLDCNSNIFSIRQLYRDLIGAAAGLAERQAGVIRFPAGADPDLEPAQEGVAYVFGSKRIDRRALPNDGDVADPNDDAVCVQHLFGLDCSGFTRLVFAGAGITLGEGTWAQSHPAEWGPSAVPAELGLSPVWIAKGATSRWLTGDLMFFFSPTSGRITHVGLVVESGGGWQVWNCSGSNSHSCALNMSTKYGITAWLGSDIDAGLKLPIAGVVRLVPTCAVAAMTGSSDTVASLDAEWAALQQRWNDEIGLYVSIWLDCNRLRNPPGCTNEIGERAPLYACPILREMLCVLQRQALFLEYETSELYFSYALISGLLNFTLADGSSCGCR